MIGVHEIALIESVISEVEQSARENGIVRVLRVKLLVGEWTAALPSSLEFCWSVLREGTLLGEAELEIQVCPGHALAIDFFEGDESIDSDQGDELKGECTGIESEDAVQHSEGQ